MDQIPVTGRAHESAPTGTRGSTPTRLWKSGRIRGFAPTWVRAWLVVALLIGSGSSRTLPEQIDFSRTVGSVVSGFSRTVFAEQEFAARNAAPVTFLQINDVYSTVAVDGLGGLARVATLKKNLANAGRTPFLVIAGDFLSPSVTSSVFKGEHMIAALNAAGLDLATLGNHEFDFGDDELIRRMHEATFQWVVSNVVDTNTSMPIGNAAPFVVKTFVALKIGPESGSLISNAIETYVTAKHDVAPAVDGRITIR